MCELLVGLGDVNVLAVVDTCRTAPLNGADRDRVATPVTCASCGAVATIKDRPPVVLVDLPAFGRPTRLRWIKRRWRCPDPRCEVGSWTELEPSIAGPWLSMTTRAGTWACARRAAAAGPWPRSPRNSAVTGTPSTTP
jgi:transposase